MSVSMLFHLKIFWCGLDNGSLVECYCVNWRLLGVFCLFLLFFTLTARSVAFSGIPSCLYFAALFVSLAILRCHCMLFQFLPHTWTASMLEIRNQRTKKKNVWFLFAFCFTLASVAASTCCIVVSRILVTVVSTRTVWKPCSRRNSEKLSCDES